MFGNSFGTGLTFTKVLSGLSKTLNVANQVIPLYREAKPLINNARTVLSVFKGMNSSNNSNNNIQKIDNTPTIKKDTSFKRTNNPSFFL